MKGQDQQPDSHSSNSESWLLRALSVTSIFDACSQHSVSCLWMSHLKLLLSVFHIIILCKESLVASPAPHQQRNFFRSHLLTFDLNFSLSFSSAFCPCLCLILTVFLAPPSWGNLSCQALSFLSNLLIYLMFPWLYRQVLLLYSPHCVWGNEGTHKPATCLRFM